jgi:hypothetical protein
MSLFQKNNNGNTCYRLSFPVYLEDKDQGSNHIDFFASKEDLNSLFIFMSESVGLLEMTPHYELGGYRIEYFTASKEVNGVTKRIGPTRVTISKIADPSLEGQLGYFTITKSQVGLLFGKQNFKLLSFIQGQSLVTSSGIDGDFQFLNFITESFQISLFILQMGIEEKSYCFTSDF